ncbi:MAG: glycosyltransferase family 9 protein [Burkholderiaceae bacterium]|nr:glycosyltransferase family 9 protein [Burkholderiaceae bacterium]
MTNQIVPQELLRNANRILFIAHLALGDFAYLQNCFRQFAAAYPHIKLDLWVDELRRTDRAADWPFLQKYALYDWLAACPYFSRVYNQTYSPALFEQSVFEAQRQNYPIVVSLAVLHRPEYARLARRLSPSGFIVGQKKRWFPHFSRFLAYRQLDAAIPAYSSSKVGQTHISEIYAGWFGAMFGAQTVPQDRFPFVEIPPEWQRRTREQLVQWGFSPGGESGKVVFVNAFSKAQDRNWPLERVVELIRALRQKEAYVDAGFIVNAVPEELARVRALLANAGLARTHLFSADENFFQLPAVLSFCDLIVSVETAVMHLANAVQVPVVALMRQRNPEWVPIDRERSTIITVPGKRDWVAAITVEQVVEVVQQQNFPEASHAAVR